MILPRFLAELKHRKVYRAAVVYAAVGWALLEVSDVVLPRLGLPDWTVNVVLAVVLLGFPLAIVFAWIFDLSPQGVVRTKPLSHSGHTHRSSAVSVVEFALICVLVATVGYLYLDRLSLQKGTVELESAVQEKPEPSQPSVPNPAEYRAIAVLPFVDLSEAGDQSWFAEGIAEELLHALASVKQLRVMARTSSFAFKNSDKTITEIAEILGVQAVLEGSVRRSSDRVRITAQLVDASTGFHIWSGSYERNITDIFQLQDELAKSVVETLRIELGVAASVPLVAEQTRIPEAYDWFMRGRALFDWPNPQATLRSLSHFKKAAEIDPSYADAWGYISYNYMILMVYRPFAEFGPPAIAAYEKALALDPEQNDALTVKALMTQLLEHDWEAAGYIYQRAIASDNSSHAALRGYAIFYLQFIEKQSQAIEIFTNTTNLDPLHAGRKASLSGMLYFAGDNEGAIREAQKALQLDPQHILAITYLILAYTDTNNMLALESLLAQIPSVLHEQAEIKAMVGWSYGARGETEKAQKIYRELLESIDSLTPLATFHAASLALLLGEIEESIDLLELLEKRASYLTFWSKLYPPNWGPIRENPRYQALLERIGLDDDSVAALNERMSFN
jgi:TolB-like protein/Tfp pilus assembly protein PilF